MDTIITIGLVLMALMTGLALGWLLAGRNAAAIRSERDRLQERAAQTDRLRASLDEAGRQRDRAERDLAAERATMIERAAGFERSMTELRDAKEALSQQFSDVGSK